MSDRPSPHSFVLPDLETADGRLPSWIGSNAIVLSATFVPHRPRSPFPTLSAAEVRRQEQVLVAQTAAGASAIWEEFATPAARAGQVLSALRGLAPEAVGMAARYGTTIGAFAWVMFHARAAGPVPHDGYVAGRPDLWFSRDPDGNVLLRQFRHADGRWHELAWLRVEQAHLRDAAGREVGTDFRAGDFLLVEKAWLEQFPAEPQDTPDWPAPPTEPAPALPETLTPPAPTPPLPGFTPDAPAPLVETGPSAQAQAPLVLEARRNDGLPPELRTQSDRARAAAEAADPEVARALAPEERRAHHLINMANVKRYSDLFIAAARAGWRTDERENMALLPASEEAQRKLRDAGVSRPYHDSGHREWNELVEQKLLRIRAELDATGLPDDSGDYAEQARDLVEGLQREMRDQLGGKQRVLWHWPTPGQAPG